MITLRNLLGQSVPVNMLIRNFDTGKEELTTLFIPGRATLQLDETKIVKADIDRLVSKKILRKY